MKNFAKKLVTLLMSCCLLASCASVVGPRDVELPLHKMQAGVEKRFPINQRILELVQLQLTNPRVSTIPEGDRVSLAMDARATPPFSNKSWTGNLVLSGRLVIDHARTAVLLAEPRVDSFVIDGLEEGRRQQFAGAATALMSQFVAEMPLYHFRPEDLRHAGVEFVPTRIRATPRGLVVAVEPVR